MVSDTVVVKWLFFVVKRAANHYWFTALSSNHVCNIKEMKQTHSLVYAGTHALKQKDRTDYLGLLIVTLFMLDD